MLRRVSNDPNDVGAFCASLKDANANFVEGLFDVCFHDTSTEVGKKPWETVDDDLRHLALRTLNGICLVDTRACRQLSKDAFVKEIAGCIKQDGNRKETDQVGALALLQTLALREHRVDHEFRRIGGVHALSTVLADTSASTKARKKAGETLAYLLHSTAQIASDVDVSETLPLERKEAEELLSEPLVEWLSSGLPLRSWQSEEEQHNAMREWWEDLFARLDTQNGTVHGVGADASSEGPSLLPSAVETPVSNP